jgi:hypothetical protein
MPATQALSCIAPFGVEPFAQLADGTTAMLILLPGQNLHALYNQTHTSWEWHGPIMESAAGWAWATTPWTWGWQALGQVRDGPTEAGQKSLVFRRSIYAAADIAARKLLTTANIRIIRPGHSARPALYRQLLGLHARHS